MFFPKTAKEQILCAKHAPDWLCFLMHKITIKVKLFVNVDSLMILTTCPDVGVCFC